MHCVTRSAVLLSLGALLLMPALAPAAEKPPEVSHDGLVLQKDTRFKMVYLKPGADFSKYRRVALLDCAVAFSKNWIRDMRTDPVMDVDRNDMKRIQKQLSEEFRKVFTEELTKGGYEVVTTGADDVIVLRPAIIDLTINAPDTMSAGRSRTFSTSAGSMTLYLEVYDSVSSEILARVADPKGGRDMGFIQWQNSVTNKAAADRALRKWADILRDGLDTARKGSAQPAPAPAPAAPPAA